MPTLGWGAGVCIVAAGWVVGLRSLSDNSFFTHLATGRIMLDTGSVPSVDPYTFTALGEPWVVQSWLASLLYATVEAVAGAPGLRVLMGATAATVTALAWRLTRPAASLIARLLLGIVFVAASAELWAERPLMLGLVAMACTVLAGEGVLDPRWLAPCGWLWVNAHGSFPLGLAYLAVVALGSRVDGDLPRTELRAVRWLGLGVVAGAVGPLGPKVLVFPVELLGRQDLLSHVIEWQPPTFDSFSQRAFLIQLVLAVFLLVRRPSYRHGLVLGVFAAAALLGARNVTIASLVLLPGMAAGVPEVGALRGRDRAPLGGMLAAVGVAVAMIFGAARLGQRDFDLRMYPIDALAFLNQSGVVLRDHHLAAPDVVGNVVELVYGPAGVVFYDDRFDMFPSDVSEANLGLVELGPGVRSNLERYEIELVTWGRTDALGQLLAVDPDWRTLYTDDQWVLACRRGSALGGRLGSC
jgi:hypothetical protein